MEVFEKECARFGIEEDAEKLRYSGSLLDYAVKKKDFTGSKKTMDEGTLIDIIAAGLPDFITDRINKEDILHTKDLFNELGKLEHLVVERKKKKEEPKLIKENVPFVKIEEEFQNENLEISQKIPIQRSEIVSKETNKTDIHSKEKKSDNLVNFNEDFSEENFKICINHLNHQEQIVIDELISKNKYVFAKDKYDIGMINKRYLHLLSDHFTRYAYVLTSSTQNANDFIKLIRNCAETDDIELILSDQYPGINSKEFKRFLDEKKIAIIFTSVNSPFSNGLNERLNQTLVNKIRCKINEHDTRIAWTTIAHDCVNKYNDTEHTVTGYAPSYLLYGKDVTFLPNELKQKKTEYDLIQARKKALENTIKSHNYNKTIYDKNRKHIDFKVGDIVFVENGNKLNRKKLDELRLGPYKIEEKISNSIYKINTGHQKSGSNFSTFQNLHLPLCA
ncbi:hypothetical protein EVAR_42860_1 [Eumeta japonica]|uniref:Integrase catalytic domain-containing protein n=1 Tax=Eumeta variegata TaxID=151549 RepID=A0A4C1ZRY3_EUMVA|nr:hypothetical protein EVAR_42860_1 [Eumeta japonica]